jgi:hypothetical protein
MMGAFVLFRGAMTAALVGLELAASMIQVHGVGVHGKVVTSGRAGPGRLRRLARPVGYPDH